MEQQPMTVVGLRAKNFKRLEAVKITPNETGVFPVRGRNAAGKSSVLDAIASALGGKNACPAEAVHEGATGAEVLVDLGEIEVRRRWNAEGATKLEVRTKDGAKYGKPQQVLDALTSHFCDPVAFLRMGPKEQAEEVLNAAGLEEKLAELAQVEADAAEERREIGRDLKHANVAAEQAEAAISELDFSKDEELLSFDEAMEALRQERGKQQLWTDASKAAADLEDRLRRAVEARGRDQEDIDRLKVKMEDALARLEATVDAEKSIALELEAARKRVGTCEASDVHGAEDRLEEARWTEESRQARTQAQKLRLAADALQQGHDGADSLVTDIRQQRKDLIGETDFPIDGLGWDPDRGLLFKGLPFSQASQAEQLRVSASIAMHGDPQIRVLWVRDGSLLDEEGIGLLSAMAESNGFQVFLEIVDSDPEGPGVFIESGQVYDGKLEEGEDAA